MIDSILLYTGFVVAAAGAISLVVPLRFLAISSRGAGALVTAAGIVLAVIALALPAKEKRAIASSSLLDSVMPAWQFDERHEIVVNASPAKTMQAVRTVPADEITLFRTLTAIRRFGRKGPDSILNPPQHQPLVDVATRSGFVFLEDDGTHEFVVGTVIIAPPGNFRGLRLTPEIFRRASRQQGVALATMNFSVTPIGPSVSHVVTETRIFANTPDAMRRFAVYWRLIHPGSDIIRRMWLRAIKRRAEA